MNACTNEWGYQISWVRVQISCDTRNHIDTQCHMTIITSVLKAKYTGVRGYQQLNNIRE